VQTGHALRIRRATMDTAAVARRTPQRTCYRSPMTLPVKVIGDDAFRPKSSSSGKWQNDEEKGQPDAPASEGPW
jgi:hypothetical protein